MFGFSLRWFYAVGGFGLVVGDSGFLIFALLHFLGAGFGLRGLGCLLIVFCVF